MKVGSISRSAAPAGESISAQPQSIAATCKRLPLKFIGTSLPTCPDTYAHHPAERVSAERIVSIAVVEEGRRFVEEVVDVNVNLTFSQRTLMREVPGGVQVNSGPRMNIVAAAGNIAVSIQDERINSTAAPILVAADIVHEDVKRIVAHVPAGVEAQLACNGWEG